MDHPLSVFLQGNPQDQNQVPQDDTGRMIFELAHVFNVDKAVKTLRRFEKTPTHNMLCFQTKLCFQPKINVQVNKKGPGTFEARWDLDPSARVCVSDCPVKTFSRWQVESQGKILLHTLPQQELKALVEKKCHSCLKLSSKTKKALPRLLSRLLCTL